MRQPFERAVQQHSLVVLRFCRTLLEDQAAQDAWQEAFLSALKAWPQLPEEANVRAWLLAIARRKALDELRRQARSSTLPVDFDQLPASSAALERVEHVQLWQAVRQLPGRQRQVVACRYLGGLGYAQIAALLGGTEAAARRAAADGIKKLRTSSLLAGYLEEDA